jgi:poly(A) polymerase
VVYKDKKSNLLFTFDFVDFRGKDLKEDLLKRDFTVNALALPIPFTSKTRLIDYQRGRQDLKNKVVRASNPAVFDDDPLRVLRAFSMSAIFGMKIDPGTLRLIRKKKDLLSSVAGERVRDELFKIFDSPESWRTLLRMDKEGVLQIVIPQVRVMHHVRQGGYHHLDVWGHSLETVKKLDLLLGRIAGQKDCVAYLDEAISGDRRRRALIKLAALLHDIGKPEAFEVKQGKTMFHGHERIGRQIADTVSDKLKLSTREKFALDTIIFWHLRPGYLGDNETLTERAVFRYFRDTGEEAASVLLVSVADQRATRGPMATLKSRRRHERISFELLRRYFEQKKQAPFIRLISGNDLIGKLKLTPGPVFSKILSAVEEAQAEGQIKTKAEALVFAKKVAAELEESED